MAGSENGRVERLARLGVEVGLNLVPGQDVVVLCLVEHAPLARAIAEAAYAAGARYVDVGYGDNHVRRALVELAPDESVDWTPPWRTERITYLGENRARSCRSPATRSRTSSLTSTRRASGGQRGRKGWPRRCSARSTASGSIGRSSPIRTRAGHSRCSASPTSTGSGTRSRPRFGSTSPIRPPPGAPTLAAARADGAADGARFDAVRFRGPGTDLRSACCPKPVALGAGFDTVWGRPFVANLPTEEIYTTPDFRRTEGTVRSTRPLALGGTIVEGLELRFEGGRAVDVTATVGAEAIQAQLDSTRPPPRSARSRSSTARPPSARPGLPSSPRSSTRTQPATSPTAPESWTPSRARTASSRTSSRRPASTSPSCTRTSWSEAPRSTSTESPRAERKSRSSATTFSCSSRRSRARTRDLLAP